MREEDAAGHSIFRTFTEEEAKTAQKLHSDGMPVKNILVSLRSEFGNNRATAKDVHN